MRENDQRADTTTVYTYTNGNITGKKVYKYTLGDVGAEIKSTSYGYSNSEWRDLLTSFNGQAVTYDEIGNPLTFGSKSFEWCGRQLERITDGDNTYVYAYNTDGDRVSKTVNGVKTEYFYNGSILAGQKTGDETLIFMYDNNGDAFGFIYNGEEYYYIKNVQNDIVAIADKNGTVVANYYYDAWGNVTQITGNTALAQTNPLRYRSYYYDSETGFYYVSSRYYYPEVGRWISPEPNVDYGEFDEGSEILGYNVYAYCFNNPVNNFDPTGEFVISTAVLIGIGIGALIGGVAGGGYGYNKAVKRNIPKGQRWRYVVGYGLVGAVIGGVIGGFVGYGVGVALGAKTSSGLVIKSVSKSLSSVSRNTIHHIMQSKHAWGRVLRNATWKNVKGLINTTIKKGATTLINSQGRALIYEAVRNNVVVRYAIIDGVIKISDAWVKTR